MAVIPSCVVTPEVVEKCKEGLQGCNLLKVSITECINGDSVLIIKNERDISLFYGSISHFPNNCGLVIASGFSFYQYHDEFLQFFDRLIVALVYGWGGYSRILYSWASGQEVLADVLRKMGFVDVDYSFNNLRTENDIFFLSKTLGE